MARIRTIKPEFWTSEQVVECSPLARLLFIGLWNFCDDAGIHPASVKRLKMEVFPGDDISLQKIRNFVTELLDNGLLGEYAVEGNTFWVVTGWHHQKIDRPSYKYPPPPDSPNTRRGLDEEPSNNPRTIVARHPPEGKGREGKGKEVDLSTSNEVEVDSVPLPTNPPPCPHQNVIDAYHEALPMCPRVRAWNKTREGYLRARWKEDPARQHLDWWRKFFEYISQSEFLTGRSEGTAGRPPFLVDLEWILRPNNFAKIVEGHYHRGGKSP